MENHNPEIMHNDALETIEAEGPLSKEVHTRMMPDEFDNLPFVWRKDYIAPGDAEHLNISIGDVIALYTEHVTGVAGYDVGRILEELYKWCKSGDPQALQRSYEFMYHINRYLYTAGIGKMVK